MTSMGVGLLAGCTTTSATGGSTSTTRPDRTSTPTDSPTNPSTTDEGFTESEFNVSTSKVAPTHRYYLHITKVYSTAAVKREEGEQPVQVQVHA